MDPKATLSALLTALANPGDYDNPEDQRQDVLDMLGNLKQWIERGGYLPEVQEDAIKATTHTYRITMDFTR